MILDRLRRMIDPARRSFSLPPSESTKTELELEQQARQDEKDRTDQLARMLNDYRRQDKLLRR